MLFEHGPDHGIFILIAAISDITRRCTEKQLKALNITFPQFGALVALSQKDGITQRELSEIIDIDTTTMMVICDSLEKKDLLQRLRDPSDRRVNRLVLTDSGKEVVAKAYPQVLDNYRKVLAETSPDELKTTVQFLEKLYRNASDIMDREGIKCNIDES